MVRFLFKIRAAKKPGVQNSIRSGRWWYYQNKLLLNGSKTI